MFDATSIIFRLLNWLTMHWAHNTALNELISWERAAQFVVNLSMRRICTFRRAKVVGGPTWSRTLLRAISKIITIPTLHASLRKSQGSNINLNEHEFLMRMCLTLSMFGLFDASISRAFHCTSTRLRLCIACYAGQTFKGSYYTILLEAKSDTQFWLNCESDGLRTLIVLYLTLPNS